MNNEKLIEEVVEIIKKGQHIVMVVGAGVSTESGIPDFRGAKGSRSNPKEANKILRPLKEKLSKIKYPKEIDRHPYYKLLFGHDMLLLIKPNTSHFAIVELEKMGKLKCLISQNVDNLFLRAGFPKEKIMELHGNCFRLKCKECGIYYPAISLRQKVLENLSYIPKCKKCGGMLRSSVINFGDSLPEKELKTAIKESLKADVLIAIGSTLNVTPACDMVNYAKENKAKIIIINLGKTDKDYLADIKIEGKSGEILSQIVKGLKN